MKVKVPLPTVTMFVAVLYLFPTAALAAGESFFDSTYRAHAVVQMSLQNSPSEVSNPQTFVLKGQVVVRNFRIGDADGDGKPDVQTEIIDMNLTGTGPQGLAINLNSSKSNRSRGMAESLLSARGINSPNLLLRLPADSFFDVFPELTLTRLITENSIDTYITSEPIHAEGIAKNLTNLSGTYTSRKSISITLHDRVVGTLTLLAINLNSSKSN